MLNPGHPYRLTDSDVDVLNTIESYVAGQESHEGAVILWDSHLALQERHADICREFEVTEDSEWSCGDGSHSGKVMYRHYADMLLSFLCLR